MLYDELPTPAQAVDSEAAMEFLKEATKLASTTELQDIGDRLERKSALFRAHLAVDRIDALDEDTLGSVVGHIFSLRRKTGRLLKRHGLAPIRDELKALLYGDDPVAGRFDRFVTAVDAVEPAMAVALAAEALHFSQPSRYWLWTYWIWDPDRGTGALPLVTNEACGLDANCSAGERYERVGRATLAVDAQGHATGYSRSGQGLFGTDVFLACVYSIYMFTVFRAKLSQEFNRILPEMPELVQRVLGVQRLGAGHG